MPEVTDSSEPGEPPQDSPTPAEGTTASLASRRRRQRLPKEPTQEELDALPVKERLELINQRRASIHQTLNSIGILFGVLFTAASLVATAVTVRTTQRELRNNQRQVQNGQNELRNSQQGQITDRYTKAVDQLGSNKLDIRLGGIYALERLASDSPRDDRTVYDVLCAFVREHDPKAKAKIPDQPTTDIQAALTVIGRRKPLGDGFIPDLRGIRTPYAGLTQAKLPNAVLVGADLSRAILVVADLSGANLFNADLSGAVLVGADLSGAHLVGADLSGAFLSGADLRRVEGMTRDQIRQQAHTDSSTRF